MPINKNINLDAIPSLGKLDTITKIVPIPKDIPGGNYWTTVTSLNEYRTGCGAFTIGGHLYVACGLSNGAGRRLTTEQYDDSGNIWLMRADYNQTGVTNVGPFSLSLGYIVGGVDAGSISTNALSGYNEVSNSWATKSIMPTARRATSVFTLNSYGYVVKGLLGGPNWTTVNERFDEGTNSWISRQPVSQGTDHSSGFATNGFGYCSHGRAAIGSYINTSVRYDDVLNSWSNMASALIARMPNSGAMINDRGYAVGGYNGSNLATNEEYYDIVNIWVTKTPNLNSVSNLRLESLNGNGYSCGGEDLNVGTGLSHVTQYKNYHLVTLASILKKSPVHPKSISVIATVDDNQVNVPVQLRTNGIDWRLLTSGITSALKTHQSFPVTYAPKTSGNRDYELRVGIPFGMGSSTPGFWISRASLVNVSTDPGTFQLEGFGFVFGGTSGSSVLSLTQKYNDFTNIWINALPVSSHSSRAMQGSTTLNGVGFSFGGSTDGGASGSATSSQKYIGELNSWSSITSLLAGRYLSNVFPLNSFAYVVGGGNTSAVSQTDNQQYNDSTNAWTSKAAISPANRAGAGFSINGFGYIAYGESNVTLATSQMYNDGANTWIARATGTTPRSVLSEFCLKDKGLVFCGDIGGGDSAVVNEYIDTLNTWLIKVNHPNAKRRPGGISINNRGYSVGGYTSSSLGDVNQYNVDIHADNIVISLIIDEPAGFKIPVNGVWSARAGNPSGRSDSISFSILDKHLTALGFNGSSVSNRSDRFDDILNSWTITGSPATARNIGAGFSFNELGYAVGGIDGGGSNVNLVDQFDPSSGLWVVKAALPQVLSYLPSFATESYGYTAGGYTGSVLVKNVYRYDDTINTWTSKKDMNAPTNASIGFAISGYGYAACGNVGSVIATVQQYNESADIWNSALSAITARREAAGFSINGRGMIVNGSINNAGTLTSTSEEYIHDLNFWVSRNSPSTSRRAFMGSAVSQKGFVCGGWNGSTRLTNMDRYIP